MTEIPDPIVQATQYTVNRLPEDGFDSHVFALTVEYRGDGRWGVYRNAHCCLGNDGTWSYGYGWRDGAQEPSSDEEWAEYHAGRDAWFAAHRFDEETALKLAREHAPLVTVNGRKVADALRMAERRPE